jgi:hypothetical protein
MIRDRDCPRQRSGRVVGGYVAGQLSDNAMTQIEEFAHDARNWARQTIIFTLQYDVTNAKTAAEVQAQVVEASDSSLDIMNRLWATAGTGSTDLSQALHKFIRLVLEWSSEHLSGRTNGRAASS